MSASEAGASKAIALQLLSSLSAYEAQVAQLLECPEDAALYRSASEHIDRIRMYSASLPALSVPWVEVLIRHFEFMHALWRLQRGACARAELGALHLHLSQAVSELTRRGGRLLAAPH